MLTVDPLISCANFLSKSKKRIQKKGLKGLNCENEYEIREGSASKSPKYLENEVEMDLLKDKIKGGLSKTLKSPKSDPNLPEKCEKTDDFERKLVRGDEITKGGLSKTLKSPKSDPSLPEKCEKTYDFEMKLVRGDEIVKDPKLPEKSDIVEVKMAKGGMTINDPKIRLF